MRIPALLLASATTLFSQTPPAAEPAAPKPAENQPPAATTPAAPAPSTQIEQTLSVPEPGRFKTLFQPFRTDAAALSPDGKYLAYTLRNEGSVSIAVLDIDHPQKMVSLVTAVTDEAATPMLAINQREQTPGRVNWLKWVSPTRLVAETNQVISQTVGADANWAGWRGIVIAMDADGGNPKVIATPRDIVEPPAPTGFPTAKRDNTMLGTTPDQPTASDTEDTTGLAAAEADLADPTAAEPLGDFSSNPRSLRVFDLDPAKPDAVTVVASGSGTPQRLGLYSVDASTGKMSALAEEIALTNHDSLIDRQGHIRLTLPNTKLADFPFRYEYYGSKGKNRGKQLDEFISLAQADAFTISPDNFFGTRAVPLGFDEDPEILYYASNVGRDTYGIYSVNLTTKERGKITFESPRFDLIAAPESSFPDARTLVFDRFERKLIGVRYDRDVRTALWLKAEWNDLQRGLEQRFPGRSVEIVDWDQRANRFLIVTQGPADPGAFFVFDREKGQLMEFVRRAPWLDEKHSHTTIPFAFAIPDGTQVSGLVTAPGKPRLKPVPMIVLCADMPWQRVRPGYQGDVQALADMGFAVVQLNGRGGWGRGLKQRQSLPAGGYDIAQVDDIVTAITNLEKMFAVNPRRVAVMGRGHGGFIALRAIQTYPDKFRCAVAVDAPVDLRAWLEEQRWSTDDVQATLRKAWFGDEARLKAKPLVSKPAITKPILMLNYPGPEGGPRTAAYGRARQFAGATRTSEAVAVFKDLPTDYTRGLPAARSEAFEEIEAFLNQYIYTPNVKIGDTIFKDEPTP